MAAVKKFDPMEFARELSEHGHVAGVIGHSVYVRYNGYIWQVMGGDVVHPSLKISHDVSVADVHWVYA